MMRVGIACLLLGLALPAAAAEPGAFRFSKAIERPSVDQECILAVVLDSDVYAATRRPFRTSASSTRRARKCPSSWRKPPQVERDRCGRPARAASSPCTSRTTASSWSCISTSDARAAEGLSIFTPLRNYERRVRVSGSKDGTAWTPLVGDGLVFDYSRYMDVANREVRLPANDFRQLKIEVAGIGDTKESPFLELTRKYRDGKEAETIEKTVLQRRPFRMDRIELWRQGTVMVSEEDKRADYPVAAFRAEEDAAGKRTIVHVQTHREPLTKFTLGTSSRNFSRAVAIEQPLDAQRAERVGRAGPRHRSRWWISAATTARRWASAFPRSASRSTAS